MMYTLTPKYYMPVVQTSIASTLLYVFMCSHLYLFSYDKNMYIYFQIYLNLILYISIIASVVLNKFLIKKNNKRMNLDINEKEHYQKLHKNLLKRINPLCICLYLSSMITTMIVSQNFLYQTSHPTKHVNISFIVCLFMLYNFLSSYYMHNLIL